MSVGRPKAESVGYPPRETLDAPRPSKGTDGFETHPSVSFSSGLLLRDGPRLRRCCEEVIQLTGANGFDECVDDGGEFVLGRDCDTGFALLELDGLGAELHRHHNLAG